MEPALAESAPKLTYEDYRRIPDDGLRHELVDGVEYVSPAPGDKHQAVSLALVYALETHLRRTRAGTLRFAPYDVRLDLATVVQPDLLVVLAGNLSRLEPDGCHGAPDLVVEILSRSSPEHDVIRKRRLYERAGVREYWILDPDLGRIDVYRPEAERVFARPVVLFADQGDALDSPLLPGLAVPLTAIFEPGGRWTDPAVP